MKKRITKVVAMLMSASMLLAMAGCGEKAQPESAESTAEKSSETSVSDSEVESSVEELEPVELHWVI